MATILSLNLFILHRLRNKLSAYINHARCLFPGDLTSTRAVCVGTSHSQIPLITGLEPGTFLNEHPPPTVEVVTCINDYKLTDGCKHIYAIED